MPTRAPASALVAVPAVVSLRPPLAALPVGVWAAGGFVRGLLCIIQFFTGGNCLCSNYESCTDSCQVSTVGPALSRNASPTCQMRGSPQDASHSTGMNRHVLLVHTSSGTAPASPRHSLQELGSLLQCPPLHTTATDSIPAHSPQGLSRPQNQHKLLPWAMVVCSPVFCSQCHIHPNHSLHAARKITLNQSRKERLTRDHTRVFQLLLNTWTNDLLAPSFMNKHVLKAKHPRITTPQSFLKNRKFAISAFKVLWF